jgi:hypothetical protein
MNWCKFHSIKYGVHKNFEIFLFGSVNLTEFFKRKVKSENSVCSYLTNKLNN